MTGGGHPPFNRKLNDLFQARGVESFREATWVSQGRCSDLGGAGKSFDPQRRA